METLQPYVVALVVIFLFSAFVKCLTVFSIFRYGLGLSGSAFGLVLVIVSLALSLMILAPQIEDSGGLDSIFSPSSSSVLELSSKYSPILEKYTDSDVLSNFSKLADKIKYSEHTTNTEDLGNGNKNPLATDTKFSILVASYVVSEVKRAFEIGLFLLIPFLVLDLIVANVLLLLGATNIQHTVVALPLKILLFFTVDGWQLLSEKLISAYI